MLIPGSVVLLCLITYTKLGDIIFVVSKQFNSAVFLTTAWCVAAYIIGLIHNMLMDWWWSPFRNNPSHIGVVYSKLKENAQKQGVDKYSLELYHDEGGLNSFITCDCFFFRAITILINVLFYPLLCIKNCLCKLKSSDNSAIQKGVILDYYYKTYYHVEKKRNLSHVAAMESQVALMRNLLFPLILLSLKMDRFVVGNYYAEYLKITLLVMATCMAFAVVSRQENIYRCVFEDNEYLNFIDSKAASALQ